MSETFKPNGQGLLRVIKATQCSIKGIKAAYTHEAAFRQEAWLALVLLPVGWFTSESLGQFVALVSCLILLLIVELLNSAVEAVVDRISLEHSVLAGRAKDMGSAAVTLSLVIVALVWGHHFYNYFFSG